MAISLSKFAPRAVVLTVVGYCAWPSLMEFAPPSTTSKPQIKRSEPLLQLKPVVSQPPTTNPWGGRDAATLAAARKAAEANVAPTAGTPNKTKAARISPAQLLARLTLNATYVAADRQQAVINGQLCDVGQTTRFLDAAGVETAPCKIIRVLPQKVTLDCGGTMLELTYSDSAARNPLGNKTAAASNPSSFSSRPVDK
ncbi:MAG: hypothetical protein ABFC54_04605 [Thermoguttaceae bacterium]